MRAPAEASYDLHGVHLVVASDDSAVAEAVDRRLHTFAADRPASADLRFEYVVGDGDGNGVVPPPGPLRPIYDAPDGEIFYDAAADVLWSDLRGVRFRCEPASGIARFACSAYTGRPLYLASHALATIGLIELLKRRGRYSLHAACLARGDRGVLVAGPSGAGKSTLSIALVRAGLSILADDMIFLVERDDRVAALNFPDAVGVTEQTVRFFGDLGVVLEGARESGFPKRLVRMEQLFDVGTVTSCEPVAIVFPEVRTGQPSELTPLDPGEAWLRLVPDVLLTEPGATRAHVATLAALMRQVRCYRLQAGPELDESAAMIAGVL